MNTRQHQLVNASVPCPAGGMAGGILTAEDRHAAFLNDTGHRGVRPRGLSVSSVVTLRNPLSGLSGQSPQRRLIYRFTATTATI